MLAGLDIGLNYDDDDDSNRFESTVRYLESLVESAVIQMDRLTRINLQLLNMRNRIHDLYSVWRLKKFARFEYSQFPKEKI